MSPEQDGPQKQCARPTPSSTLPPSSSQSDDGEEGASKFATFKPAPPIGAGSNPPQVPPNLSQSDDGEEGASEFATFKPAPPIGSGSDPPQLRKDGTVPKGPPADDQPTRRREDEPESIDSGESGADETVTIHPRAARNPPPSPKNAFPRALLAKFEPIEELGAGGMGVVWLVRHRALKEERAVKLIHPHIARDEISLERLRREAQAMARVRHPHAVAVYDVCIDDVPYIEMEFLRGRPLNTVLKSERLLPLKQVAKIVEQLCDALQYAHDNQIIHRDLKPSNLLLVDGKSAAEINLKVLDFGLAKFLGPSHERTLTVPGAGMGTPAYMSPEQIDDSIGMDVRSDLFTVGVILYELLAGSRPFISPKYYGLIYEITQTPAPPFRVRNPDSRVAPEIEKFVLRCLEKEPSKRPSSARELADEFLRIIGPQISDLRDKEAASGKLGRRWFVAGAIGLSLGGLWLFSIRTPKPSPFSMSTTKLIIKAGESKFIRIRVPPQYPAAQMRVEPGLPKDIVVQPPKSNDDGELLFLVDVDPNLNPQTCTVSFLTGQGQSLSTELVIESPPLSPLPPKWERAPNPDGPNLVRLHIDEEREIYPRVIEYKHPGISRPVVALLVEKKPNRPGQPEPFYIMKDKVWVELFELFANENPQLVQSSGWKNDQKKLWPALGVSGREAEKFAKWLGGNLPTTDQWDQAAGKNWNAQDVRIWPFQEAVELDRSWKLGVAAGMLREPLDVGTASLDISPYKCRDMSGNGVEWTRPKSGEYSTSSSVELRAASFRDAKPFSFRDLDVAGSYYFDRSNLPIGFRVVIELPVVNE